MTTKRRWSWVAGAAIVALGAASTLLHLDNQRRRQRIAELRASRAQVEQLRASDVRRQARPQGNTLDIPSAETLAARQEIAQLERRAEARRAEKLALAARDADALASNRDPRRGPMRLEHFQNCGQSTPAAAFQTLVWATIKGDEAMLARLCILPSATRAQAQAIIAKLPPEAQSQWTPEQLVILAGTDAFTDLPALHITGEHLTDAQHAIVTFRAPGQTEDEKVKLTSGPDGWRMVVSTGIIKKLEKKLSPTPPPPR